MGRIRTIKPEFFRSRSLAKVSIPARLTFAGLWTEADDHGNGVADADLLKGALWPKDRDVDAHAVEAHLAELAGEHILLYEVSGERYFHVLRWRLHQSAAYRRGEAKFPPPSELHGAECALHDSAREVVLEGKGRDRKGEHAAPPLARDHGFSEFWSVYPRRRGRKVGKERALERWSKLDLATRRLAFKAAKRYAEACDAGETIAKDAERFLARDYWRDWLEDAAPTPPTRPTGVPEGAVPDGNGGWVVSGVAS